MLKNEAGHREKENQNALIIRMLSDSIGAKERRSNTELTAVPHQMMEQHFVRDTVAGIPVHFEKSLNNFVLEMTIANPKGAKHFVSAAVETLALHAAQKVVKSPEFISRFYNVVVDNPGFSTTVASFVQFKQQKLVSKQAKIDDRRQQFVVAWTKLDLPLIFIASEGNDRQTTDISGDKKNP